MSTTNQIRIAPAFKVKDPSSIKYEEDEYQNINLSEIDELPQDYEPANLKMVMGKNLIAQGFYDARSPIETDKSFSSIAESHMDHTDPNVDMHSNALALYQNQVQNSQNTKKNFNYKLYDEDDPSNNNLIMTSPFDMDINQSPLLNKHHYQYDAEVNQSRQNLSQNQQNLQKVVPQSNQNNQNNYNEKLNRKSLTKVSDRNVISGTKIALRLRLKKLDDDLEISDDENFCKERGGNQFDDGNLLMVQQYNDFAHQNDELLNTQMYRKNKRRSSKSALATVGGGVVSASDSGNEENTNKEKHNMSIEYFSMGVNNLDQTKNTFRRMKTDAETKQNKQYLQEDGALGNLVQNDNSQFSYMQKSGYTYLNTAGGINQYSQEVEIRTVSLNNGNAAFQANLRYQQAVDQKSLLTYSQNSENNSQKKLHKSNQVAPMQSQSNTTSVSLLNRNQKLLEITSNLQSKQISIQNSTPQNYSPKPESKNYHTNVSVSSHQGSQQILKPLQKPKSTKKVTFRDKVQKGSEIADVFIVEKIKYPSKQDEEDSGTISCVCAIF